MEKETFWAYGCVEFTSADKEKHCEICEVYFESGKRVRDKKQKAIGCCQLTFAEIRKNREMVLKDLEQQTRFCVRITCGPDGTFHVSRKKG